LRFKVPQVPIPIWRAARFSRKEPRQCRASNLEDAFAAVRRRPRGFWHDCYRKIPSQAGLPMFTHLLPEGGLHIVGEHYQHYASFAGR